MHHKKSLELITELLETIPNEEFIDLYSSTEKRIGLTINEVNQLFGDTVIDENYNYEDIQCIG